MAQLIVRGIEAKVIAKLRQRAKQNARSLGEEVGEILRDAVRREDSAGEGLGTRIASRFRDVGLKPGEEIEEIRDLRLQVPDFEK